MKYLFIALALFSFEPAHAWGKRGHAIVCETAAYLAAREPKAAFVRGHAFDLGYYCNVPDIVWKKPATYDVEWTNHFMDMEIFEREIKTDRAKAFAMNRLEFNAKYPSVKEEAGRAFWRVRELLDAMDGLVTELRKADLTKEQRHKLQGDWLVHAGAIGHYIGDLVQPLHVTENFDGQLSDQKGIHAYFEDEAVDVLFADGLATAVMKRAEQKAKSFKSKDALSLMLDLAAGSHKDLAALLKIDKKLGRTVKAPSAYREMIMDRMAFGAVVLADLWKHRTGFEYDGKRFFTFVGTPEYLYPPRATPSPTPAP